MTKDIEYGNQRYQQGYEAGYEVGFDAGVNAEVTDELWDEGFNEGYEAGELEGYDLGHHDGKQEGYEEGYRAGFEYEQQRIHAVIKMQMQWAEDQNKGRDYMFWKGVKEILTPVQFEPWSEERWAEEMEKDGF